MVSTGCCAGRLCRPRGRREGWRGGLCGIPWLCTHHRAGLDRLCRDDAAASAAADCHRHLCTAARCVVRVISMGAQQAGCVHCGALRSPRRSCEAIPHPRPPAQLRPLDRGGPPCRWPQQPFSFFIEKVSLGPFLQLQIFWCPLISPPASGCSCAAGACCSWMQRRRICGCWAFRGGRCPRPRAGGRSRIGRSRGPPTI